MLRTTKQVDRRLAQAVAADLDRAARLARSGELTESNARKIISDLMLRVGSNETLRTISIEAHLNAWLSGKETNRSAATATRYAPVVAGFLASLGARATKPLSALAPRDVELYAAGLAKRGLASGTVALHCTIVRSALTYAVRQGLIPTNPATAVELPRVVTKERGAFADAEIGILLGAATEEWKTLIMTAFYTGLRLGDSAALEWDAVNLATSTIRVKMEKTRAMIEIPLHPELLKHLEQLAGTDSPAQFVMPTLATAPHAGGNGLSTQFAKLMRAAGIASNDGNGNRRTFHSLRHGFTSRLANAGIAPELRMRLTGHKSAAVHQGYTHMEMQTLRSAVDKLPALAP